MTPQCTSGSHALTGGAAILDLSARGRIRVIGEDRARLLHAMTTNHIQDMKPGDVLYAFFLNAQGRVLGDVFVLCFEDHFLLDTEPETRQSICEHLDKYIIADDVTLDDVTGETFCLGVEGPAVSSKLIERAGAGHETMAGLTFAAISSTGAPAVRIYGPLASKADMMQSIGKSGAIPATPEEAESVRIQHYKPRYGQDITDSTLPQETQQTHALHFQKGCYLGQEIVERIRSRGHVNKHLMGFHSESHIVPPRGTTLIAGGKEIGEVTSATLAEDGKVYGLAYVRTPYEKPGTTVGILGRPAELHAPAAALS